MPVEGKKTATGDTTTCAQQHRQLSPPDTCWSF